MIRLTYGYQNKINKIREYYGNGIELNKVEEELDELLQAVKLWRYFREQPELDRDVLEEVADVYVVLEHLKSIVGIADYDVECQMQYKIDREIKRISCD